MTPAAIRAEVERLRLPNREVRITTSVGMTIYCRVLGWIGPERVHVLERARERTRLIPIRTITKIEEVRS